MEILRNLLIENLVHDIPGVALALEMAGDIGDVVLKDTDHRVPVVDLPDPGWELAVPEQSVASHQLAVGSGKVDDLVCIAIVELTAVWLEGIPFHAVLFKHQCPLRFDVSRLTAYLASDLAKILIQDLLGLVVAESPRIRDVAIVQLAFGNKSFIDAVGAASGRAWIGLACNQWHGDHTASNGKDLESSLGMHLERIGSIKQNIFVAVRRMAGLLKHLEYEETRKAGDLYTCFTLVSLVDGDVCSGCSKGAGIVVVAKDHLFETPKRQSVYHWYGVVRPHMVHPPFPMGSREPPAGTKTGFSHISPDLQSNEIYSNPVGEVRKPGSGLHRSSSAKENNSLPSNVLGCTKPLGRATEAMGGEVKNQ